MFVLLIRAQGMQGLGTQDAYDRAEDICLLEVDVNQFGNALFNVLDSFTNVADFEFGRKRDRAVESLWIEGHCAKTFSRFVEQCKPLLTARAGGNTDFILGLPLIAKNFRTSNSICCYLEESRIVLNANAFVSYRNCGGY